MPLTKVLITVKTYPTLSAKYDELVCTAGFLENGAWVRIYPIQFRQNPYDQQYRKYQWIEVDLVKNTSDFRPESYRPRSHDREIKIAGTIPSDGEAWHDRRKIVLGKIYYNLSELITEAKNKKICTSLAVFKPTKIIDLEVEAVGSEWSPAKVAKLQQLNIFHSSGDGNVQVVRKLPYKFSYVFEDNQGKRSKMMNEDWEIGQLYWNCLSRHYGNQKMACQDVKNKYLQDFAKTKDLYLFLGSTQKFHFVAPNPFVIIGTFHPQHITQTKLF